MNQRGGSGEWGWEKFRLIKYIRVFEMSFPPLPESHGHFGVTSFCQSCIHWSSVVLLLQQIDKGIRIQGVQKPGPTDFTRRLYLQEAHALLSCTQMSYGKNVLAHKFYIDHAVSILSTYNYNSNNNEEKYW